MTNTAITTEQATRNPHLPSRGRRIPISTYRIQLGPDMPFDKAIKALDYLEGLGITDVYVSPILQAAPGSTHGYDVVDHTRINESLGGREGFERFAQAVHKRNMGVIVDVVPNHMGVPTPIYHNKALWSVLREGPDSPYARWFDGTDALEQEDGDGILMPVLGQRIGTCLAAGEISLENRVVEGFEDEGPQPVIVYFDHVFPVRAGTEHLPLPMCLAEQYYRLAYWKVASEELNFRRFFDVDTLLAVRVEDPEVFDATHALLFDLYKAGHIDGFRIDHPDGLADPRGYMRRLSTATGGAWIVAEKILEPDEDMPDDWPVAGTTGYDASWRIEQLLVDQDGNSDMAQVAHTIAGDIPGSFEELKLNAKEEITTTSLIAEVHRIASLAYQICKDDIMLRDHTQGWIAQCIVEMVIAFPRYRAYVVPGEPASDEAVELITETAALARQKLDADLHDTLDVVVDLVLGRPVGSQEHAQHEMRDELVVRFQQVCGAVTAKGVEDTAFYRWTHMVGLNEVGGSPTSWSINPDTFHAWCSQMASTWPATMTNGTTHDNKRSEDVRVRINTLSQYAAEWKGVVARLHEAVEGIEGHTENLLWQIMVGTWTDDGPIERERLTEYMIKASREQKLWTGWTTVDEAGEEKLRDTIEALYANDAVMGTLADWYELTNPTVREGILSRKVLQLTCMGVADTYQTAETIQNYLVDPDNRGAADFSALRSLARHVDAHGPRSLAEEKFHITRQILRLRRRRPETFVSSHSAYRPLPSSTGHVVSFSRGEPADVVVIATRGQRAMTGSSFTDHTVVLPEGQWTDVLTNRHFTGGTVAISDLLETFGCAVLEETSDGPHTSMIQAITARHDAHHHADRESKEDAGGLLGWLTRRFFEDDEAK